MIPYIATCFGVRKLRPAGSSNVFIGLIFLLALIQSLPVQSQCALACKGKINVSIGENCQAILLPTQILTNGLDCPDARYRVDIFDYNMKKIPTNPVITFDYLNMVVIASVYDSTSRNSCWTHALIEEKNAPIIFCRKDTVYCNDSIVHYPPFFFDWCDPYPTIKKTFEEHTIFPCDSHLIKLIVRGWVATDSRGNVSLPCIDSIWLKRAEIDSVKYPKNWTVADNCNLECNGHYPLDAEGHPHPDYTGSPTIGGNPLWPTFNAYCNLAVSYEDIVIIKNTCKTKILRIWRVVEWWCSTANIRTYQQYIEIADTQGPSLHCPYDITVSTSTGYNCQAYFPFPPVQAVDSCQDSLAYEIYSDGLLISKINGGYVTLGLGDHDIEYRVYDACYNSTSCRIIATVEDKNPPVAVCQQGIVVSMSRSDSIHVYAEVFDDGSHDECHLDSFLVRRMDNGAPCLYQDKTFRPYVSFCCEDVGKTIMVIFRVTDQSGNVNDCMVEVEIQDKSAPVIHCPHDYSIDCSKHIDTVDLSRFGFPSYYDNCVVHMHEYVDTFLNQCGLGYLRRNFVIEDNMLRRDTCSQKIYVTNPRPFQGNQIVWPRDTIIYQCARNVDPKNLPDGYNYPAFLNVECSLPGHNYVDDVFNYILDSSLCFKVLRKWTVIDWCQEYFDADSNRHFVSWEHLQIIKVSNKIPPKIEDRCDTINMCLTGSNCFKERVRISHTAHDDCTPDDLLRAGFKLDLYNNGFIDSIYNANGNVASWDGELPLGIHRIIWVFEDQCGNRQVCDQIIRIINCKIPTAYCLTGIAVNLSSIDVNGDGIPEGVVDVWAADVDHGSYQQCGNPITLSFSTDTLDRYRRYTCDSLGNRRVELWVTDRLTGFKDRCITTITIQDNNKLCKGNITSGKVAGLISTPDGRAIPASIINLEDQNKINEKIASSDYSFENLKLGNDYKVTVKNDQDYLSGVTTLDIVKIQKHILGKEEFENVWQYLAADVTNDEKVTSGDISALRKLILGIDYKFKNSLSWKYVISNYQFPDLTNPWLEAIPSTYYYPSIPGDMNYTNFYGIKTGDVSQSNWSSLKHSPETRTNSSLTLYAKILDDKTVQIYSENEQELLGMQFTMKFNNSLNQLNRVSQGSMNIDNSNVAYQYIQNGLILVSWNNAESIKVSKERTLFNLEFDQPITKELLESLELNSDVVQAEAYDDKEQILDLRWSGNSNISNPADLQIGSPVPNPFNDVTTIVLEARKNSEFKYQISDVNGNLVMSQEGFATQGKNYIKIKGSSLPVDGIYLIRIEASGLTKSFKLIKMHN
ncbi:MAG: T9SS type A sorting domain-containing protein [Saprospiraceae bacterium]